MLNYARQILGDEDETQYPIDSVYWLASNISFSTNSIRIDIQPEFALGREDLQFTNTLKPLADYVIPVKKERQMTNVLVSSGTFYKINDLFLVTQRTDDARYDPGAWTSPAGRCDYLPAVTAFRETLEELLVIEKSSGKKMIPKPCIPFAEGDFDSIVGEVKGAAGEDKNFFIVETYFLNELLETTTAWAWLNDNVNTLELRLMIDCQYDNVQDLKFSNPEFHTKTQLITADTLSQYPCTPTLSYFLNNS